MGCGASLEYAGQKYGKKYRERSKQKSPKKYDAAELAGSSGTFETSDSTPLAGHHEPPNRGPPPVNTRTDRYRPSKESTASTATPTVRGDEHPVTVAAPHRASGTPSKEQLESNRDDRDASKRTVTNSKEQPADRGYGSKKVSSGRDTNEAAKEVRLRRRATTVGLSQAHSRERILKERRASSDDPMGGLEVNMKVVGTSKAGQEMGAGTVIGAGSTPGMVMVRMEVSGREMALSAAKLKVVEEGSHDAAQLRMEHSRRRHSIA
jgi:hypothetical protein